MSNLSYIINNITGIVPKLPDIPLSQDINYTNFDGLYVAIMSIIFGIFSFIAIIRTIYKENCKNYQEVENKNRDIVLI